MRRPSSRALCGTSGSRAGENPAGAVCHHMRTRRRCKCDGDRPAVTCPMALALDIQVLARGPTLPPRAGGSPGRHIYEEGVWKCLNQAEHHRPTPACLFINPDRHLSDIEPAGGASDASSHSPRNTAFAPSPGKSYPRPVTPRPTTKPPRAVLAPNADIRPPIGAPKPPPISISRWGTQTAQRNAHQYLDNMDFRVREGWMPPEATTRSASSSTWPSPPPVNIFRPDLQGPQPHHQDENYLGGMD
jgi:hypothetical protein